MKITELNVKIIRDYYNNKRTRFLFVSFLFFLVSFHIHALGFTYQSDDLLRLNEPSSVETYLKQYRYMEGLASWLLSIFNSSPIHISTLSFLIFSAAYATFSTLIFTLATGKRIHFITFIISALICASPFLASILIFKSAVMAQALGMIGVLTYTISSIALAGWKRAAGSALGVFIALASYQPYLSLVAISLLTISFNEIRVKCTSDIYKKFKIITNNAFNFIIGLLMYFLTIVIFKLFILKSITDERGGIASINDIVKRLNSPMDWFFIPYGAADPLLSLSLTPILLSLFFVSLASSLHKKDIESAIMGLTILIVCSITSVIPFLIFETIWIDSRTQMAGILAVSLATTIMIKNNKLSHIAISVLAFCATVVAASGTQRIYYEQWAINIEDRMRAFSIHDNLLKFSKGKLENYQIILNNSPWTFTNSSSTSHRDRSMSALSIPWSAKSVFNFVSEKNLNITVARDSEICLNSAKWPDEGSIIGEKNKIYVCF